MFFQDYFLFTVLSLWWTYRALIPFNTLLDISFYFKVLTLYEVREVKLCSFLKFLWLLEWKQHFLPAGHVSATAAGVLASAPHWTDNASVSWTWRDTAVEGELPVFYVMSHASSGNMCSSFPDFQKKKGFNNNSQ